MNSILVVDDEKSMREFLTIMLENDGHEVATSDSGEKAVEMIRGKEFDLVLTDFRMRGANGIDVLEAARNGWPSTPVVMMTAYATPETAVEAMKKGAYDYISKPFKIEELQLIIKNAMEQKKLSDENRYLRSALRDKYGFANIIGQSPAMNKVFDLIERVADNNSTLLILGESGTGKELVAKAAHYNGARRNEPFISINCGAVPESLLESELFGHEKGAFTGADSAKMGLMQAAHKGSFFMDEVGGTPLGLQVKLLRALQEREITRLGSSKPMSIDFRLIVASKLDLAQAVRENKFREDLYYRLNVIPVRLPPLRERREDIPLLATHFVHKFNEAHKRERKIQGIEAKALTILEKYDWPGNVRQLENTIERAVVLERSDIISEGSLPEEILEGRGVANRVNPLLNDCPCDLEKTLDEFEKKMIGAALDRSNGVINKAANLLNLSFRSMRYRIQKYHLKSRDNEGD